MKRSIAEPVSFLGQVIGTHNRKTIKVRVPKLFIHPVVEKPVFRTRNFHAHDEGEKCVIGDVVKITVCESMSKTKHFKLDEVVLPAKRFLDPNSDIVKGKDNAPLPELFSHTSEEYEERYAAWKNSSEKYGFRLPPKYAKFAQEAQRFYEPITAATPDGEELSSKKKRFIPSKNYPWYSLMVGDVSA